MTALDWHRREHRDGRDGTTGAAMNQGWVDGRGIGAGVGVVGVCTVRGTLIISLISRGSGGGAYKILPRQMNIRIE